MSDLAISGRIHGTGLNCARYVLSPQTRHSVPGFVVTDSDGASLPVNMKRAQGAAPVPNRTVLRVHRLLGVSKMTVRKVIDGKPLRSRMREDAIRQELKRRGYDLPTIGVAT